MSGCCLINARSLRHQSAESPPGGDAVQATPATRQLRAGGVEQVGRPGLVAAHNGFFVQVIMSSPRSPGQREPAPAALHIGETIDHPVLGPSPLQHRLVRSAAGALHMLSITCYMPGQSCHKSGSEMLHFVWLCTVVMLRSRGWPRGRRRRRQQTRGAVLWIGVAFLLSNSCCFPGVTTANTRRGLSRNASIAPACV